MNIHAKTAVRRERANIQANAKLLLIILRLFGFVQIFFILVGATVLRPAAGVFVQGGCIGVVVVSLKLSLEFRLPDVTLPVAGLQYWRYSAVLADHCSYVRRWRPLEALCQIQYRIAF